MKAVYILFFISSCSLLVQASQAPQKKLHALRQNAIWAAIQNPRSAREFLDEYNGNDKDCIAKALGFISDQPNKPGQTTYNEYLQKFGYTTEMPKSFTMSALKK